MRLNRKQKIFRNLLVSLLALVLAWAADGFPPYTVAGMCRRAERQYLLEEVEPLYVLNNQIDYSGEWLDTHCTYVLAKAGETYLEFQYERHLLQGHFTEPRSSRGNIAKGALCAARNGILYVAGPLADAASAKAVVTVKGDVPGKPASMNFTFAGERLAEEVFGFSYYEGDARFHSFDFDGEYDLIEAAWDYHSTTYYGGGRGLNHVEMPCTVTLYDEAGAVLDVWKLTIGTYDINSWK